MGRWRFATSARPQISCESLNAFVFMTMKLDAAIHVPENDLIQPVPRNAQQLTQKKRNHAVGIKGCALEHRKKKATPSRS